MLADETMSRALKVRERFGREVFVSGLSKYRVSNTEELLSLLCRSESFRKVRSTEMNDTSSRSHALVKIHVEITRRDATALTSMLTLVDLAGSEKWNTSIEMASVQEKELTNINSSLSTLSNCIRCLVSGDPHVPYRESKLTRILQHALEGNSLTTLLATVSPMSFCFEETLSTLRFAESAGKLCTKVSTNVVVDDSTRLRLALKEIRKLKQQLLKSTKDITKRDSEIEKMKATIEKLKDENQSLNREISSWKDRVDMMKNATVLSSSSSLFPSSNREVREDIPETSLLLERQWNHETDQELAVGSNLAFENGDCANSAFEFLEKIASVDPSEANHLSKEYSYFARLKARREELEKQLREIESGNVDVDHDDDSVHSDTTMMHLMIRLQSPHDLTLRVVISQK